MTRQFIKSAVLGGAVVQLIAYEPLINAVNAAREELQRTASWPHRSRAGTVFEFLYLHADSERRVQGLIV